MNDREQRLSCMEEAIEVPQGSKIPIWLTGKGLRKTFRASQRGRISSRYAIPRWHSLSYGLLRVSAVLDGPPATLQYAKPVLLTVICYGFGYVYKPRSSIIKRVVHFLAYGDEHYVLSLPSRPSSSRKLSALTSSVLP